MTSKLPKISEREKDVMTILWHNDKPLTASAITEKKAGLSINTVQAVLRSLLKKQFIKVAEIVYSGTVLTRSYQPIITAEEYATDQLQALRLNTLNFSTLNFIDDLLNNDKSIILEDLEELIRKRKERE
nr:BlaI/MecI/CopY family transcriptional regulator [uncultured Clostridium sp.]